MKKKKLCKAREFINELIPEAMVMDEHDNAIIGIASRIGMEDVVAYDKNQIISNLIEEGMTEEEAIEYFDFNIIGAYVGETTPVFITREE